MLRDLPKTVPSAVLSAASAALEETEDLIRRQRDAHDAYTGSAYRHQTRVARDGGHDLPAKAQALIEWGAKLQDDLPTAYLLGRFRTKADPNPCFSVVRHEIALPATAGFQGGVLRTELLLTLDRKEGVFRHFDWFDGFRMTGGGLLNSQAGILYALHPAMLNAIHDLVAEGDVWRRVEVGLGRLVEAFKDR